MKKCPILMFLIWLSLVATFPVVTFSQPTGGIQGEVILKETGRGLRGAEVIIMELGRSTVTDAQGAYQFAAIPPGTYHLFAHIGSAVTEEAKPVTVMEGETAFLGFSLELTVLKHEVTITASGKVETAFESFQGVDSFDAFDLTEEGRGSLGESLDHRVGTGVAKRAFGPGSARPIIRGFDGDRVLIMQDGIRTGTLSSQSGDHGELVNALEQDRIEIVKGPATLLYGGNAMGGTVNAISRHHDFSQHAHHHEGLRGFVTGSGGTANSLGGGGAGFEYGKRRTMFWGSGSGNRAGDYTVAGGGKVRNSEYWLTGGRFGFGYYGDRTFYAFEGGYQTGRNGVPFAADLHGEAEGAGEAELDRVAIDSRRWDTRFSVGLSRFGPAVERFLLKLSYTKWNHDEIESFQDGGSAVGTAFDNQQFVYRGEFEQRPVGRLSGRFGFWGMTRAFDARGEEALSPPVDQDALAAFVLEEVDYERFRFQFGGRLEWNRYDPAFVQRADRDGEFPEAMRRSFTGGSASAGARANLWDGGAFLANYYHSYRAPALEELYNFGPHLGNLAFEIGDPTLDAERGNGVDLSLRHDLRRARVTLNYFYYDFGDFIFPFATGEVSEGLRVIEFTQLDARFTGGEAKLGIDLHPNLWLNLAADYVNAKGKANNTPLPRIPPMRGKIGLDYHWKNLSVRPELIVANQQHLNFTGETRTPGYAVWNLKASYSIPGTTLIHQFAVDVFNIGDRLYRNHSSFIKDLAPEIGRGVRLSYTVRFF